jgi:iron complex transport system substrate-binding protein
MKRGLVRLRSLWRIGVSPLSGRVPPASWIVAGSAAAIVVGLFVITRTAPVFAADSGPPLRLISLNPSLTAIVFRLGAGDALVGIDDYSAQVLEGVADLPRVGGLFDPSLEAVVALRPDRVLMVAGMNQQTHAERLERLGVEVEIYQNERLDQVLENIERLGRLLDREDEAAARVKAILEMRRAVAAATAGRVRLATVAIVDRSPLYLVGRETFLDEMLASVGAQNLGRELSQGYPQASIEWLISARPELLLDMTPGAEAAEAFWSRWPSLPAVVKGRVLTLEASRVSLPGPDLDEALRALALIVHGDEVGPLIDAALAEGAATDPPGGAVEAAWTPSLPRAGAGKDAKDAKEAGIP